DALPICVRSVFSSRKSFGISYWLEIRVGSNYRGRYYCYIHSSRGLFSGSMDRLFSSFGYVTWRGITCYSWFILCWRNFWIKCFYGRGGYILLKHLGERLCVRWTMGRHYWVWFNLYDWIYGACTCSCTSYVNEKYENCLNSNSMDDNL